MKELIIFVCTDSTEIFLSKLRSSCWNYNLPSFFTDSYCAGGGGGGGGVSNNRVPTSTGKPGKPGKSPKKVPCMEKSWNLKKTEKSWKNHGIW